MVKPCHLRPNLKKLRWIKNKQLHTQKRSRKEEKENNNNNNNMDVMETKASIEVNKNYYYYYKAMRNSDAAATRNASQVQQHTIKKRTKKK